MSRPTIPDLAKAAGVSTATVNRVLAGAENVRPATRLIVREAAEKINFYGAGAIQSRVAATRPKYRLGFLLLQPHRPFYQLLGKVIQEVATQVHDAMVTIKIEYLEDLSPQNTAERALSLAAECQSICITSAVHPLVIQAVESIQARGVPVFALISQLAATGRVHYVGLDHWKVGRTAAWTVQNICKVPGKVGILMGNHRYRNQEMNESGFRSYFREHAPDFTLLEPLSTFESSTIAQEMTERLLQDHADLSALYVAGGGISGVVTALRNSGRAGKIVVIAYDMMDVTRAALLDGTLTLVISHPLHRLAEVAIAGMIRAITAPAPGGNYTSILPFDLHTRENI